MMVSVNPDDLALVVRLACLTESRAEDEQQALVATAEVLRLAGGTDVMASVIHSWDQPE